MLFKVGEFNLISEFILSQPTFISGGVEIKFHQGNMLQIGNYVVIVAGFERTIHSDTYVYFVANPEAVFYHNSL